MVSKYTVGRVVPIKPARSYFQEDAKVWAGPQPDPDYVQPTEAELEAMLAVAPGIEVVEHKERQERCAFIDEYMVTVRNKMRDKFLARWAIDKRVPK
jgi:hypothetical protein